MNLWDVRVGQVVCMAAMYRNGNFSPSDQYIGTVEGLQCNVAGETCVVVRWDGCGKDVLLPECIDLLTFSSHQEIMEKRKKAQNE